MSVVRPELRRLVAIELGVPLKEYDPANPDCVGLMVDAYIGSEGIPGEDIFEFLVRTPRYLLTEVTQKGPIFGRNLVLLPRYTYELLWKCISELCLQIEGPDWETVALRLGRYGLWEYDDDAGLTPAINSSAVMQ